MDSKDTVIIVQYTKICELKDQIQALKEQISLIEQSKQSTPMQTAVI